MFALDSFGPNLTLWQQLGAFIIHLVPSFILLAILLIAWKWELIGGILLTVMGLLATPWIYHLNYHRTQSVSTSLLILLIITFPFVLTGILFIVSYYARRKKDHLMDSNHSMS
jgi:type VI protein secretion system component VasK